MAYVVNNINQININNALSPNTLGFEYDPAARNRSTYIARVPGNHKLTPAQIIVLAKICYLNKQENVGAWEKELNTNGKVIGPLRLAEYIILKEGRLWLTEKAITSLKVNMDFEYYKQVRNLAHVEKLKIQSGHLDVRKAVNLHTFRELRHHDPATDHTVAETLLKNLIKTHMFAVKRALHTYDSKQDAALEIFFNGNPVSQGGLKTRLAHVCKIHEISSFEFFIGDDLNCHVIVKWKLRPDSVPMTTSFHTHLDHV